MLRNPICGRIQVVRYLWKRTEVLLPQNVNEALEECKVLAAATADPALGWQNVLKKGWLTVDRYKPEGRNEVTSVSFFTVTRIYIPLNSRAFAKSFNIN